MILKTQKIISKTITKNEMKESTSRKTHIFEK